MKAIADSIVELCKLSFADENYSEKCIWRNLRWNIVNSIILSIHFYQKFFNFFNRKGYIIQTISVHSLCQYVEFKSSV